MVFIAHLSYSFSKFLFHVRAYGIWPNNMSSGREMIPCEEIRNRCRVKICRLKLYVIIQYYKKWKIFKFAFHGSKAPYEKMLFYIFYSFFFHKGSFCSPLTCYSTAPCIRIHDAFYNFTALLFMKNHYERDFCICACIFYNYFWSILRVLMLQHTDFSPSN